MKFTALPEAIVSAEPVVRPIRRLPPHLPYSFEPTVGLSTTGYAERLVGWKRIAADLGVGVGTIYRVGLDGSKIREKVF